MNLDERTRAYLYRIGFAVVALAAVYGVIGEDEVTGWTSLVVALFGTGLATLNTSRHPDA